jgi:protein-S-isoprenylcysteine O-methyltransferase Ste14
MHASKNHNVNLGILLPAIRLLVGVPVFFGLLMFPAAGTIAWVQGWMYLAVFVAWEIVSLISTWRTNPELLAARSRFQKGAKRWDRVLAVFLFIPMVAIFPVAGFDAGRFHWLAVPWWGIGLGYLVASVGLAIATWAGNVNKFAEWTVRIQTERGHRVIDSGPYSVVRHPGYAAAFLLLPGTALALGSLWALIPAGIALTLLAVRTELEDKTLQSELDGYKEYTQRVRYKLIPGMW